MTKTVAPPDPQKWLTLDEAGELIGVQAQTIRRWVNNGQLPAWTADHDR